VNILFFLSLSLGISIEHVSGHLHESYEFRTSSKRYIQLRRTSEKETNESRRCCPRVYLIIIERSIVLAYRNDSTRCREMVSIQYKMMRITLMNTLDYLEQRFVRIKNNIIVFQCELKEINGYCAVTKETI